MLVDGEGTHREVLDWEICKISWSRGLLQAIDLQGNEQLSCYYCLTSHIRQLNLCQLSLRSLGRYVFNRAFEMTSKTFRAATSRCIIR